MCCRDDDDGLVVVIFDDSLSGDDRCLSYVLDMKRKSIEIIVEFFDRSFNVGDVL